MANEKKFNPTMNSQISGQKTVHCIPSFTRQAKPTFRRLRALGQIQRVVVFVIFTIFSPWEEEGRGKSTSASHGKKYGR